MSAERINFMNKTKILVEDLHLYYGENHALKGVNSAASMAIMMVFPAETEALM